MTLPCVIFAQRGLHSPLTCNPVSAYNFDVEKARWGNLEEQAKGLPVEGASITVKVCRAFLRLHTVGNVQCQPKKEPLGQEFRRRDGREA